MAAGKIVGAPAAPEDTGVELDIEADSIETESDPENTDFQRTIPGTSAARTMALGTVLVDL